MRGDLQPRLILTGTLEAVESTRLSVPPNPHGRVAIQWMAEDGSEVTRGDPLVELDSSASAAIVDDLRLDLVRAVRELERIRAQVEADTIRARSSVEVARIDLSKAELDASVPHSIMAAFDTEQRLLALDRARAAFNKASGALDVQLQTGAHTIAIAEIELAQAQRRLAEAETAIDELSITAPHDGIFIVANHRWEGRKRQVGDSVWVGEQVGSMPILDHMRVRAGLSDVDDGKVEAGVRVRCTLDSYPERSSWGVVTAVDEVAQEADYISTRRFFDVLIDLEQSDPATTRPGMSVLVEVPLAPITRALLVPRSAIDPSSSPPRVQLAGDRWREVLVRSCSATECAVEGDLAPGTPLVRWEGIR